MKVAVAQTKPFKGQIEQNIIQHQRLINLALAAGAEMLFFPELSLTGYEPQLAKTLGIDPNDSLLNNFQTISDTQQIAIGVGMPTKHDSDMHISMILFQPWQSRQVYSKQYLHPDEYPYFKNGQQEVFLAEKKVALAICYELFIPAHSENAAQNGSVIYIASVAKSAEGIKKASLQLANIAQQYGMTVLMANCTGHCDNFESAGGSAIWNNKGTLLAQLHHTCEGILMIDTATQAITEKIL